MLGHFVEFVNVPLTQPHSLVSEKTSLHVVLVVIISIWLF